MAAREHPQIDRIKQRLAAGNLRVVPILLKPVNLMSTPFGMLQVLPRDGVAIASRPNQTEAFAEITRDLWRVLQIL